ncbi:hypothetical protein XELAEV_18004009mg [Xenopus laevis]|uniref:Fibronectin type-III domain-containing protein n=1 Tax=Xenopus laevis TaxID=8355 RepID=A0A974BSA8_XENLA|nr:hypothetical protein XELAEV_18004009mg [Xenopus laevis]
MSPSFLAPLILTVLGVQITCSNGNPETISEQCAKPTGPGINSLSPNKDLYDQGESVTVTCAPRYQSVSDVIRCRKSRTHSNWNVPNPCFVFQLNVTLVTPTSISLQWKCDPGPCQSHWRIGVSYEAVRQNLGKRRRFPETEGVTISKLQPYTEYYITISGHTLWKETELRRIIRTKESAPGKPDFTQYPSINNNKNNNNTLKWRLSETHGVLIGYQLNISAKREYSWFFDKIESHWLRPNVTEFNMELKHGTNYTVTLQGFTSAGPGEPAVWTHETPIADQCLLSQINGINRTGVEQEYYDPEESVTVRCMEGYYPTRVKIRCMRNVRIVMWNNSAPCTEQCKKSDLSRDPNVQLVPPQDYYPPNMVVSVRCPLGYKPFWDTITCKSVQYNYMWRVHCEGKYITFKC